MSATHENFSRDEAIQGSSDRSFGLVFMTVFAVVGVWPLMFGGVVRGWALGVATGFLLTAWFAPKVLHPLNLLWMRFGLLLSKVMNPLIMGVLFYGVITPMGALMRLLGKDLLRLKLDPEADSYWIERDPPGPEPESLTNQF